MPLTLAVAATTLNFAAMRGMDVTVLRPEGFELPSTIMEGSNLLAKKSGGSVTETDNRNEAMQDAQVIYTSSWSSERYYGNKAQEDKLKQGLTKNDWCIDEHWFENAEDNCRFMHCLPVRRGITVSDEVLDGPRSVVIDEARNRMLVQMAILYKMLSNG